MTESPSDTPAPSAGPALVDPVRAVARVLERKARTVVSLGEFDRVTPALAAQVAAALAEAGYWLAPVAATSLVALAINGQSAPSPLLVRQWALVRRVCAGEVYVLAPVGAPPLAAGNPRAGTMFPVDLRRLCDLYAAASRGPWGADHLEPERADAEAFDAMQMLALDDKGRTVPIFDSHGSELLEVREQSGDDEERDRRWDAVAVRNFALVEALHAAFPSMAAELEALREAGTAAAQETASAEAVRLLDEAFAAEIPRVSTLEYNSNEICRHFYEKMRARLPGAADTPPVSLPPRDPGQVLYEEMAEAGLLRSRKSWLDLQEATRQSWRDGAAADLADAAAAAAAGL